MCLLTWYYCFQIWNVLISGNILLNISNSVNVKATPFFKGFRYLALFLNHFRKSTHITPFFTERSKSLHVFIILPWIRYYLTDCWICSMWSQKYFKCLTSRLTHAYDNSRFATRWETFALIFWNLTSNARYSLLTSLNFEKIP